jgi:YegS/Rv2252/BmrU family lipid kinase
MMTADTQAGEVRQHRFAAGDRVLVIANPATRRDAAAVVSLLEREVPPGVTLDVHWTRAPRRAREMTERLRQDARGVIAVGGDGTVSEVAAALVGTGVPLGVIPGGSTNIVARELGVPANIAASVRLLFSDHAVHPIDVGTCNEHTFLHMAGAGFDSEMFALANPRLKRKVGWIAYLPAAARALRAPMGEYTIEADGEVLSLRSPMVLVANGASIINPRIRLLPDIRKDDGWLDLIVVTATRPDELARVIARLLTMQLGTSSFVRRLRARSITVRSTRPIPVELDGDVAASTPATFGILSKAVGLIGPR